MKRKIKLTMMSTFIIATLLFLIPISMNAEELDSNNQDIEVVKIDNDIENYIETNINLANSKVKSTSNTGIEALNKFVLDSEQNLHHLTAEKQLDNTITLSDTYYNTLQRGTRKTLYTIFYVNYDYVGKIHFYATLSKYHTSTGQPYYKWSNTSGFSYDYRENSFVVKGFSPYIHNTSAYKKQSSISEKVTWDTNKSSPLTQYAYFYAPKNK